MSAASTGRADRTLIWLLAIFLFSRMFLVFRSGLPQPADLGLLLTVLLYLRQRDLLWVRRHFVPYLLFVAWAVLVNAVWSLMRFEISYAFPVSYYLYNLALVALVAAVRTRHRDAFDRMVRTAVIAAAVGQALYGFLDGTMVRAYGTFNNPNQLGFWAICIMAIHLVVRRSDQLFRDAIVIASLAFCEFVTTSRAGVIGYGALVGVWLYEATVNTRYRLVALGTVLLALAAAPAVPAVSVYMGNLEVVARLEARFNKSNSVDEVGLRNADRITKYPAYAILGAGEGDLKRFPYSLPIEIHSTPVTVLFSYGFPGTVLFGWFLLVLVRDLNWTQRAVLLALFLYSVSHNGLRFAFFWFSIGVLMAEAHHNRVTARTASRVATPPRLTLLPGSRSPSTHVARQP